MEFADYLGALHFQAQEKNRLSGEVVSMHASGATCNDIWFVCRLLKDIRLVLKAPKAEQASSIRSLIAIKVSGFVRVWKADSKAGCKNATAVSHPASICIRSHFSYACVRKHYPWLAIIIVIRYKIITIIAAFNEFTCNSAVRSFEQASASVTSSLTKKSFCLFESPSSIESGHHTDVFQWYSISVLWSKTLFLRSITDKMQLIYKWAC